MIGSRGGSAGGGPGRQTGSAERPATASNPREQTERLQRLAQMRQAVQVTQPQSGNDVRPPARIEARPQEKAQPQRAAAATIMAPAPSPEGLMTGTQRLSAAAAQHRSHGHGHAMERVTAAETTKGIGASADRLVVTSARLDAEKATFAVRDAGANLSSPMSRVTQQLAIKARQNEAAGMDRYATLKNKAPRKDAIRSADVEKEIGD